VDVQAHDSFVPVSHRNARSLRATLYTIGAVLYALILLSMLTLAGLKTPRIRAAPSAKHEAAVLIMAGLIGAGLLNRAARCVK
jgi:hypothetical protein